MTQRGEQRNVYLNDGSQIKLNTDTHIYVQERLRSRKIILSKGEASFHVAHKRSKFLRYFERSFEVTSGNMLIIDIGTVFNVHKHSSDESSVTVLDGEIAVGLKDVKNPMAIQEDIRMKQDKSIQGNKEILRYDKVIYVVPSDKSKSYLAIGCCCSRCLTAPWSNSLSVNLSHIA